jgi:peptide/nickel transport system permease protein
MPDTDGSDRAGSPPSRRTVGETKVPAISAPPRKYSDEERIRPQVLKPDGGPGSTSSRSLVRVGRAFVQNKLAVVGVSVVLIALLFCFLGPLIYHTNQTDAQAVLLGSNTQDAPPGSGHPLGTDHAGFDILGRLMFGGKNSLLVGVAAALVATIWGVLYGALSGYFSGWGDALLMRIVDFLLSIPQLFLLILLSVIFRPSKSVLILVIAFVAWLVPARLIRGETLTLRTREYVQAARMMGARHSRIVLRHIIPNAAGTVVVNATFQVADAILLLGALGFLSLGLQAPQTDWGSMLADAPSSALSGRWWEIYPAGLCIVLVVVSLNFVGDAVRDSLEVRLQHR